MNIEKLVKESTSVLDLEQKLFLAGNNFKGSSFLKYSAMISFLYNELGVFEFNGNDKQDNINNDKDILNYSEVKRNNIIYRIHGIYHGNLNITLSKPIVGIYSKRIKEFLNFPDEDYFLEEGFSELFSLSKLKEISCQDEAHKKAGFVNNFIFLTNLFIPTIYFSIANIFKKNKMDNCDKNPILMCGNNMNLGNIFRNNYISKCIPEPLHSELMRKSGYGNICADMSEIMTRKLVKKAERKKLKIAHLVVGLLHEPQIAYLLRNN